MTDRMLELLYRAFDAELSEQEQVELENALASSPDLLEEKKRVMEMRQLIGEQSAQTFKPFFAARVMRRIRETHDDFLISLMWAFKRIAVAGAVATVLLIANNIFIEKNQSLDAILGMPQLTLEDTYQLDLLVEEED